MVVCYCGSEASLKTAWTQANPGRRFYSCGSMGCRRCCFFGWFDPPICARAIDVVPGLLRTKHKLEEAIKERDSEIKILQLVLVLSWFF